MDNDELRGLLAKATPGPWAWSENGNILGHMPNGYDETREVGAIYTERDDDLPPINAELVLAMHAELPRLLADSDALAKLRAKIAELSAKWRDPHETRNYSVPFRMGLLKAADELDALLRLPAGEA